MTIVPALSAALPQSTVKVVSIAPCGDAKVCITMELVVDVHRMAEIGGEILSVATKGVLNKKSRTVV